jgi:hypothetical protein
MKRHFKIVLLACLATVCQGVQMKGLIILLVVSLLASHLAQAQGTTYLSNLGQTSAGSSPVGSDSWVASEIITGSNAGGYLLDSVQLAMADASGSPIGFTVMIDGPPTDPFIISPGNSLATLNGSMEPSTGGLYTYTASGLTLSPQTDYFLVVTAGTSITNGAYNWNFVNRSSYNPADHWKGSFTLMANNGSPWGPVSGNYLQYAINATAIPEPSTLGLLALGCSLGGGLYFRRK